MLGVVIDKMAQMQADNLKEIRGMVMDILQGRETAGRALSEEEQVSASRTPFDPPDYDAPGTEDLPGGLAAVFERHETEDIEYRTSMSESELLSQQLERARQAAGMDPQGPTSEPISSRASIGLPWPAEETET